MLKNLTGISRPYEWKGLDSDNGGEFVSWETIKWNQLSEAVSRKLNQTRSRPYCKNDQARVEKKNDTLVREFFGYERYGYQQMLTQMQKLCVQWLMYNNPFRCTMRQTAARREGSKRIREFEKEAKSRPAQRILEHTVITESARETIRQAMDRYDSWEMAEECEAALRNLWELKAALEARGVMNELDRDRVAELFCKPHFRYAPIRLTK